MLRPDIREIRAKRERLRLVRHRVFCTIAALYLATVLALLANLIHHGGH
jgi:hypothetical protein